MGVLAELDQIRDALAMPGQPFEMVEETVGGVPLKVYRNLPPNLSHVIVQALAHADRVFLVSGARRLTYREALGHAASLGQQLTSGYGVGPGMRVAIAMRNSAEWVIAFLAVLLAGATAVLVNSRGTADEILHGLRDTECALLIADGRRAEGVGAGFGGAVLVGEGGRFEASEGAALALDLETPITPSAAGPDDPALILFTSGTTGRPKGAVLTHRGVCTFLFGMRHSGAAYLAHAARRMGMEAAALAGALPQLATLAIFPFFHVSGASALLLGAVSAGGKIVIMARWNPATALELVARERITMLSGPPSIFWDTLNCPEFAAADLTSLTNVGIGGQATPPHLLAALQRAIPNAAPGGGYGMTETNGAIASGTGAEYLANPKAAGRILPGVEVRIVDDHGQDRPLGAVGEIWVRGALVMAGYWNQPEANQAVFSDGWLRTGDVGMLDGDRFITIVDRKKDVVIRGGENIYCAELERVFQDYPGVLEVAAFGVPDARWGERAVLAVVPQAGQAIEAAAMLDFGRLHLAAYKIPAEIVLRDQPFLRNAVGKIDKAALRQDYR